MKSEWDSNTGLPKDKQKLRGCFLPKLRARYPKRESLKSERDSNTEVFLKYKRIKSIND